MHAISCFGFYGFQLVDFGVLLPEHLFRFQTQFRIGLVDLVDLGQLAGFGVLLLERSFRSRIQCRIVLGQLARFAVLLPGCLFQKKFCQLVG
ncbi:hypothetical protein BN1002_00680 [Bacillus sp. B-jedd]|nr:hypothetical protein BN1002_00680 [Bacillus sp. B-jedd]